MVIFIAGIHAVGKSHLCMNYSANTNILHKSASELIKEGKKQTWESNKLTKDISDNQTILIQEVSKIKEKNQHLLLDGHFLLRNHLGQLESIELQIFKELRIDAIALIENEEDVIRKRLSQRDNNNEEWNIQDFLTLERERAYIASENLSVPLQILSAPSFEEFSSCINLFLDR